MASKLLQREARFSGRRACVMRGGPMWAALLAEEHPDKVAVLVAEVEAGREQIALAASVLAGEVQACDGYVDRCSRVVDLRAAFRAARLRRGRAWRG